MSEPGNTDSRPRLAGDELSGWLDARLAELAAAELLRSPVEVTSPQGPRLTVRCADGPQVELVNFCSNNYLNLAADRRLGQAACQAIDRWGFGSGASRLVSGQTALHRQAEQAIANFLGADDSMLLSTGYMANVAAVTSLAGPGDTVILDKLCHASLIDAARQSGARLRVYPHGDLARLEELLIRAGEAPGRRIVLTDSLFSMDGDFAPLGGIAELKDRHRFTLVLDEAHAFGVHGPGGRGVAEALRAGGAVDVFIGTCSKALGGAGGFVAGRQVLIDFLKNTARPFIYSTAPPAAAAAAVVEALRIIRAEPDRRCRLLALAESARARLVAAGWDIGPSVSQIIPIQWGSPARAVAAQRALFDNGLLVIAIRPPSVPKGKSRLRISLMCDHTQEDVERLLAGLSEARARVRA